MSEPTTLKLVAPEVETYAKERRQSGRHALAGRVTGVSSETQNDGNLSRICSLQLVNISDTGLCVLAQEAVDLDSTVAVFFPPHGPERGFDMYGQVVRCVSRETGHEIGIRLETRAAA